MRVAGPVHDILRSYYEEREHQKNLEYDHRVCNGLTWWYLATPWVEIHRGRMNGQWWGNVHPHIVTRRMAMVREHAFRNALEVFLQLRSEGRDVADIIAKYPEVYAALNAVIDPTERQLEELKCYDRTNSG